MEKANKKVIVGSTGMLGHVVVMIKEQTQYSLFNISYRNKLNDSTIICDVTEVVKLESIIKKPQPDIIINCGCFNKRPNQIRLIYFHQRLFT